MSTTTSTTGVKHGRGIVKQVLSGDSIIIRGQPKGGPPPEKYISLSNIQAPRLARRANTNVEGSVDTKDEVCYLHHLHYLIFVSFSRLLGNQERIFAKRLLARRFIFKLTTRLATTVATELFIWEQVS